MHLVSFDLKGDFGFFRKPETNNTLNVSYNMLHKPALLGLLGAVIGLKGYKKKGELPEYYQKLSKVKVGIEPLNHDKGNFTKTSIKYSNTVGYANKGTTFLTEELTLVSPQYRVFLLLDSANKDQEQLLENLKGCRTEFIPYFGKNEFTAWWERKSFKIYDYEVNISEKPERIKIKSLFIKKGAMLPIISEPRSERGNRDKVNLPFVYFERLPIDFNLELMQYELAEMVYTNFDLENSANISNLYNIKELKGYVQLN
ncbi:type I-B CRISPR-associated protein Cas5b [Gramella sp. AN32]|uniref:Type I-B CRISPR-associated protein Cas5b n=1 Tax=Christiangramia antarctica TaxID=2058158 RepID=A0ABW5X4Z0_9FLAO|nr:type I-B CRISPR-associated protein Cas5b [Gramella sp. AN32]MCM4154763.1 type I-B CRISPR-associated protein Cas5 [Gramella sp. AN32]